MFFSDFELSRQACEWMNFRMKDVGFTDLTTVFSRRFSSFSSENPCYTKLFRATKMDVIDKENDKENDVVILGENDDEYTRIPLLVSILFQFYDICLVTHA